MRKYSIVFLGFLLLTSSLLAQIDNNIALRPYLNASEALTKLDFNESIKWFDITIKNFATSEFATKSLILNTSIFLAQESSYIKMLKRLNEIKKLKAYLKEKDTKNDLKLVEDKINYYKNKLSALQNRLYNASTSLLRNSFITANQNLEITISFNLSDLDIAYMINQMKKGILPLEKEFMGFEKKDIEISFASLLTKIIPSFNISKNSLNSISGSVDQIEFFTILGVRLYYISQSMQQQSFISNAQACLEHVLKISNNDLYNKTRQVASEHLEKIKGK
ncbi:MAG: hypothetical protein ABIA04_11680 [Pseudomonadota bacterium]